MLAYDKTTLYNLFIRNEAKDALRSGCITRDQLKGIYDAHAVNLYTPHFFVRIGLGLLTIVIILVSMGLLMLLFGFDNSINGFLIFFGLLCYTMLEVMVNKKHFNSGVDNILMISAAGFIIGGIAGATYSAGSTLYLAGICSVATLIFAFLAIRFVDCIMAIAAVLTLLVCVFYSYVRLGSFTETSFPFILIFFSCIIYYLSAKGLQYPLLIYYNFVLQAVRVTALLATYFSGNYYVISEISHEVFHPLAETALPLTMGWLFWAWTLLLPLIYLIKGIKDKDLILIRAGTILIAFSVIILRYYNAILSTEVMLTLAGFLLILISFYLIKYLRNTRYGYTFKKMKTNQEGLSNLEGIIISEAFGNTPGRPAQQDTRFAGGSFGGAGAGDNY